MREEAEVSAEIRHLDGSEDQSFVFILKINASSDWKGHSQESNHIFAEPSAVKKFLLKKCHFRNFFLEPIFGYLHISSWQLSYAVVVYC